MQSRIEPKRFWLIAPLAAVGLLCAGMTVELVTRQLLAASHSAWLVRPVLYAALPKPGFREHLVALAIEGSTVLLGLWWIWFLRAVPGQRLLPLRIGVGLVVGGALGLLAAALIYDTTANLFVLKLGAWAYAFSPFDIPVFGGLAMVLWTFSTSSLDSAFEGVRWRDFLLPCIHR